MKKSIIGAIVLILVFVFAAYVVRRIEKSNPPLLEIEMPIGTDGSKNVPVSENPIVTLTTNLGTIKIELYEKDAPVTVANFLKLVGEGFYDNLTFHRVIKGFMIQGGDPNGDGTGGPGYTFKDELNPEAESYKSGYKRGVLAMANAGPNTNGSQFFIMHQDYPLPHNYTIFGKVIEGQEVVDKIATSPTGAADKPLTPAVIKQATVIQK